MWKLFCLLVLAISAVTTEKITQNLGFEKIGTFEKTDSQCEVKSYWLSTHFNVRWFEAKMLCNSYGMEFASIDSLEESNNFAANVATTDHLKTYTYISGMKKTSKSSTEWFWVESGKKIDHFLQFDSGEPSGGNELCMCFIKKPNGVFFHDVDCSNGIQGQVLCQLRESQ